MDSHTDEGIDYFTTAHEKQLYSALTSYLSLKSQIDGLVSTLSGNKITPNESARAMDQIQRDISSLGESISTQKLLIHHRHLTLDLATLADSARMKRVNVKELIDCLKFSTLDVQAIGDHFTNTLPPVFWNVRGPSEKARQVFAMPELLEMIALHCSHSDTMSMHEVCKDIHNIIGASQKLQTHLCLKPDSTDGPCTYPFYSRGTTGFACRHNDGRVQTDIYLKVDIDGVYWPQIGDRYVDMLICNPPIYRALVTEHCPLDDNEMFGLTKPTQLESATGLTVRNLYDMAEEFAGNHRGCWEYADPIQFCLYGDRKATFVVRFRECLTDQEWEDAAEETANHEECVAGRLDEEAKARQAGEEMDRARESFEDDRYGYYSSEYDDGYLGDKHDKYSERR